MGKKNKQKNNEAKAKKALNSVQRKSTFSTWVIGIVVFFALSVAGIVLFVQLNKARFIRISVMATAQTIQSELQKSRSRFTMADRDRLEKIIYSTREMAQSEKKLDPKLGSHLMFILKVSEEIIREGSIAPGELEKLEMLLSEALRIQVLNKNKK